MDTITATKPMASRLRRDERVVDAITRLSRTLLSWLAAKLTWSLRMMGMSASVKKKTRESPSRKHVVRNMGTYAQMLSPKRWPRYMRVRVLYDEVPLKPSAFGYQSIEGPGSMPGSGMPYVPSHADVPTEANSNCAMQCAYIHFFMSAVRASERSA